MARQKSTTKKTTSRPKKLTSDVIAKGEQSISYMGEVTIKLAHGKKVISSTKYHNSGMPGLFKFLCAALAGTYIDNLRPYQLKLYGFADDATADNELKNGFTWDKVDKNPRESGLQSCSPFISYMNSPKLVANVGETKELSSYSVTYHFRIPLSLISASTTPKIYAVGLFPRNETEISAYYLLTQTSTSGEISWNPIELPVESNSNHSIILDWTMTVANKPVVQQQQN